MTMADLQAPCASTPSASPTNDTKFFSNYEDDGSYPGSDKPQLSSWLLLEDLDFLFKGDFNKPPKTTSKKLSRCNRSNAGIWSLLGIPAPSSPNKKVPWIGRTAISSAFGSPKRLNRPLTPVRRTPTSRPVVLLTTSAISPRVTSLSHKKLSKMKLSLPISPSLTLSEQHIFNYFPNASKMFKNALLLLISKNSSVGKDFPKIDPKILTHIRKLEHSLEIKSPEGNAKKLKACTPRSSQHGIRLRSGKSSPLRIIGGIEFKEKEESECCPCSGEKKSIEEKLNGRNASNCDSFDADSASEQSPKKLSLSTVSASTVSIDCPNYTEESPELSSLNVQFSEKECKEIDHHASSPSRVSPHATNKKHSSFDGKENNAFNSQEEKIESILGSSPSNDALSPEFASFFKAPMASFDTNSSNLLGDDSLNSTLESNTDRRKTGKQSKKISHKQEKNKRSVPILQCFSRPKVKNSSYPHTANQTPVHGCQIFIMMKRDVRKRHRVKIASSSSTPMPESRTYSPIKRKNEPTSMSSLLHSLDDIKLSDKSSPLMEKALEDDLFNVPSVSIVEKSDLDWEETERMNVNDVDHFQPLVDYNDDKIVSTVNSYPSSLSKPSFEENASDKPMSNENYPSLSVAWNGDDGENWKGADTSIRWERLSPRLAALGKEVVCRRNAFASAASDTLQEAASAELVLSALSHFCELGTVIGIELLSECVNRFIPFHDILVSASKYNELVGKKSSRRGGEVWGMWGHVVEEGSSNMDTGNFQETSANSRRLQQTALWAGNSVNCNPHAMDSDSECKKSTEVKDMDEISCDRKYISSSESVRKSLLNDFDSISLSDRTKAERRNRKKEIPSESKKESGWKDAVKFLFCSSQKTISPAQTPLILPAHSSTSSALHSPKSRHAHSRKKVSNSKSPGYESLHSYPPSSPFSPSPSAHGVWHRSCFVSHTSPNRSHSMRSSAAIDSSKERSIVRKKQSFAKVNAIVSVTDKQNSVEDRPVIELYRQVEREARVWFVSYVRAGLDFEMHKTAQGEGDSDSLLKVAKKILAWIQNCQVWSKPALSSSRIKELQNLRIHLEEVTMLCAPFDSPNSGLKSTLNVEECQLKTI